MRGIVWVRPIWCWASWLDAKQIDVDCVIAVAEFAPGVGESVEKTNVAAFHDLEKRREFSSADVSDVVERRFGDFAGANFAFEGTAEVGAGVSFGAGKEIGLVAMKQDGIE